MSFRYLVALLTAATIGQAAVPAHAQFVNGSFETSNGTDNAGGYYGWTLHENPLPPGAGYDFGILGIAADGEVIPPFALVRDYFYNVDVQNGTNASRTYRDRARFRMSATAAS